jgi:penicillin amidase
MRRWLVRGVVVLVALLVAVVAAALLAVRASLPTLDGEVRGARVGAAVRVERDARGAVIVTAADRNDLAYALGYAHAQDRWFQMDLLRRASAGELSALLGGGMLDVDRRLRVHRFREVARAAVQRAPAAQRALLEAYAAGANAGLASLGARPWEYFVLRAKPEAWRPEDSVLVVLAMFVELQDPDGRTEIQRGLVRDALPPAAARFVYAAASEWDAALDGSRSADPVLPTPEEYDLRRLGELDFAPPPRAPRTGPAVGSNNWAVAGSRSATGAAIVANDMHLGLRVPGTWYHARLRVQRGAASLMDVTGVTLPGTPAVVAGSNGRVAWAFTNSYGDYADVVVVERDPSRADHYFAAGGSTPFRYARERIDVHGGEPVELRVALTQWGPVIGADAQGRALAYQWTAHFPEALNLDLDTLAGARSVDEALDIAAQAGIPAQNFVTGDASGRIAWTVAGRIPRRRGGDASVPRASTDPTVGFDGWLAAAERPRLVDPDGGQIWTANARVVGGDGLASIGDGGYDRGARAGQIAAALRAAGARQTASDQLAVQLDDRALFLERWRGLLAALLDDAAIAGHPQRADLREALARWSGRAGIDDVPYRFVRAFRGEVEQRAYYALIAPARARQPEFRWRVPPSFEGPLWALVTQRPVHLLPPGYADWRAFLLASVDAVLQAAAADCPRVAVCTWGARNTARIEHPLSRALPVLSRWIDMPAVPLPGDADMPRVQGRYFGASERFAIAVGHEAEGYFHMPGGQSGHPMSPYYEGTYDEWARGEPAPFLPGEPRHTLTLAP